MPLDRRFITAPPMPCHHTTTPCMYGLMHSTLSSPLITSYIDLTYIGRTVCAPADFTAQSRSQSRSPFSVAHRCCSLNGSLIVVVCCCRCHCQSIPFNGMRHHHTHTRIQLAESCISSSARRPPHPNSFVDSYPRILYKNRWCILNPLKYCIDDLL